MMQMKCLCRSLSTRPRVPALWGSPGVPATGLAAVPHALSDRAASAQPTVSLANDIRREGRGSVLYPVRTVIALAVLSGPLPKLGVIAVAGFAAVAMIARDPRGRAWGVLGALIISPVLLLASIWHSPQ